MLARSIAESLASASWIRRMFAEGERLRKQFGAENICDFSIGNPHLEPPEAVLEHLARLAADRTPGIHRYMPTCGFPEARARVADWVGRQQGVAIPPSHLLLTVGSACAINVTLRALVEPGAKIVLFAPWFAEYPFYLMHAHAKAVAVPTTETFDLDLDRLDAAIDAETCAVIMNSPNNPTGRMYPESTLAGLAEVLRRHSHGRERPIVLLADEVYRRVVFDGAVVPSVFQHYEAAILASSFSKDLGLAGERIGFLALHPKFPDADKVLTGLELCLRTLGFVNAPALLQRVVAESLDALVDIEVYRRNRDALYQVLVDAGYDVVKPEGAFFLFPKTPIADDEQFTKRLMEERILVVPGRGFGLPGYMRLSYAVSESTIARSAAGFRAARSQ